MNHVPDRGHQRPRVGRSHGHAWGIPMAVRGDFQWPPMGRMAWPSSMTEDLWMVTKGRLPSGQSRPGQRYGRPLYAGATRQRINGLVREQLLLGKNIRHWVSLLANPASGREELRSQLLAREEMLIRRWDLRRVGWNLG